MKSQLYKDIYISYAIEDSEWVEGFLLRQLEDANFRCLTEFDLLAGNPEILNKEVALKSTYKTIIVITPDWKNDCWKQFEGILLRSSDPSARKRKLIPIILRSAVMPEYISSLNAVDMRNKASQKKYLKKLIKSLEQEIPYAQLIDHSKWIDTNYWYRWIKRNRWRLYKIVALISGIWLLISMLFDFYPFHKRLGWLSIIPDNVNIENAGYGSILGDSIFISTRNDFIGCDSIFRSGIWEYNTKQEKWFPPKSIEALRIQKRNRECVIDNITDFSISKSSQILYAATVRTGLLQKEASSSNWKVVEGVLPSSISDVEVIDSTSEISTNAIVVNSERKGAFYSIDHGKSWKKPLYSWGGSLSKGGDLFFEAFASSRNRIFAATKIPRNYEPDRDSGIYSNLKEGQYDIWSRVISPQGKYSFYKIRPSPNSWPLLVAAIDGSRAKGEPMHKLLLYSSPSSSPILLHESSQKLLDIHLGDKYWYAIDDFGYYYKGALDYGNKPLQEIPLYPCLFSISPCTPQFLSKYSNEDPLLLANDKIYKISMISWFKFIFP